MYSALDERHVVNEVVPRPLYLRCLLTRQRNLAMRRLRIQGREGQVTCMAEWARSLLGASTRKKTWCTQNTMSELFPASAPLIADAPAKCIWSVMQYVFSGRSVTLVTIMEYGIVKQPGKRTTNLSRTKRRSSTQNRRRFIVHPLAPGVVMFRPESRAIRAHRLNSGVQFCSIKTLRRDSAPSPFLSRPLMIPLLHMIGRE